MLNIKSLDMACSSYIFNQLKIVLLVYDMNINKKYSI